MRIVFAGHGHVVAGVVPGDPADRLIDATAVESGCLLVTRDQRLRRHRHPRPLTIW